jgi:hypothetical protein
MITNLIIRAHDLRDMSPIPIRYMFCGGFRGKFRGKVGPTGFKGEGDIRSTITIPNAPAFGSGDCGIGSLFALNPDIKGGGANLPRGGG